MLNFENMRNVTDEMFNQSFAYAENFLQFIFDSLKFCNDWPFVDVYEFDKTSYPDGADPDDRFENAYFIIEYTCFGQLRVKFNQEPYIYDESPEHSMLQEVLQKNGFVMMEDNKTQHIVYIRGI